MSLIKITHLIDQGNIKEAITDLMKETFEHSTELEIHLSNFIENEKLFNQNRIEISQYNNARTRVLFGLLNIIQEEKKKTTIEDPLIIKVPENKAQLKTFFQKKLEGKYKILEEINNNNDNSRSIVFKARQLQSSGNAPMYSAIKIIKPFSIIGEENQKELHPDINFITKTNGLSGIIDVYEIFTKTYPWYFVMQYIEGHSISEYVEKDWTWTMWEVKELLSGITEAVNNYHALDIVHGDIKPQKILINSKDNNKPVISPFRLYKESFFNKRTPQNIMSYCRYLSPEELFGEESSYKSDQFSIGLVAYELIEGKPFYEGNTVADIMYERLKHKENYDSVEYLEKKIVKKNCPVELKEMIVTMLRFKKEDRYKHLEEVLNKIKNLKLENPFPNSINMTDKKRIIRHSFNRCKRHSGFYKTFYELLFKKNPEVKGHFNNLNKQYEMLDMAIERIVSLDRDQNYQSEYEYALINLGKKHGQYNLSDQVFDNFRCALLEAVKQFDKEEWGADNEIGEAWGDILGNAIEIVRSASKNN